MLFSSQKWLFFLWQVHHSQPNLATRSVLVSSFDSGGATIQSYRNFYGEAGDASQKFAVYGRKNDPQGRGVIKEQTKDGRTTHWVPEVQK